MSISICSLQIQNKGPHPLPHYQSKDAAGMDLHAYLDAPLTLAPMERKLIPTGLFIALPKGFEGQVRPRSGLAYKHGVTVLNAPGTIDADYRGEVKILLVNLSNQSFILQDGERIAQLVVAPYTQATLKEVSTLPLTERGVKGFGSTGK